MDTDHPAWAAHQMRSLDEHIRNALIAQSDNVVDAREYFERASLDGVEITMPHPFYILDPEE